MNKTVLSGKIQFLSVIMPSYVTPNPYSFFLPKLWLRDGVRGKPGFRETIRYCNS